MKYHILLKFLWIAVITSCNILQASAKDDMPRIAIIGSGIGGASCAHYLRELFGDDLQIDVYEKGTLGGRIATITMDGKEYESGGSILHPKNEYMVNLTKMLGLHKRDNKEGSRMGIYDGEDMVFDGSGNPFVMVLQLLWHYGLDVFRIGSYVSNLLSDFKNIYTTQDQGIAFTSPVKLIESMSPELAEKLHYSTREDFEDEGFYNVFIDQLVTGGLRTNYGQGAGIQAFVGGVSMAGVEPGLWRVHGGNKLVPIELLNRAKVNLHRLKVTKVSLKAAGGNTQYTVVSEDPSDAKVVTKKEYDIVIVANPLHSDMSGITFSHFPGPIGNFPQKFHRTVATFLKGVPSQKKFGFTAENFPDALLTSDPHLFFNSIGKHLPVDYKKGEKSDADLKSDVVYKVFSQLPLTTDQLDSLFESHDKVKVVDWLAYPTYKSHVHDMPPFELFHQLYYINGIELCASAMEMSAIGGRNVALLAFNHWNGKLSMIDPKAAMDNKAKTEL